MTDEQISYLLTLKNTGLYKRRGDSEYSISEPALFKTLFEYLRFKNRLNKVFKVKWFKKNDKNRPFNCFFDTPLTSGEASRAVKFGKEHGLVNKVNVSKTFHIWEFTDKALMKYNGGKH